MMMVSSPSSLATSLSAAALRSGLSVDPGMPLTDGQVNELLAGLRDDNESARLKACDTVAKIAPPDRAAAAPAIPALKEIFLNDRNPAVKFLAKKALQALGESPDKIRQEAEAGKGAPAAQEADRAAIARDLPVLWKCAAEELRSCVTLLTRLIWSTDERVRRQVSVALEKCGHILAAPPLLVAFEEEKKSPEWEARERQESDTFTDVREVIDLMRVQASGINPALAAQMGNLQRPEVLAAFIDMLRSGNEVLRDNAVRILAELKDARTIDPLLRLLGTGQPDLDSKVITTLSKVARTDKDLQIQILKKILSHFRPSEPETKLHCIVDAVGRIANPKTYEFVKGCLKHPLPRVRANAVEALQSFELAPEDRVRLLSPLLRDDNNRVLGNAVVALWGSSAQPFVQALVESMVAHADRWVRASVGYSMGVINAPGVVPYLLRLLEDRDEDVRRNAVKSIRRLSNRDAILALARQISNPDLNVEIYCIETIGRHALVNHADEIARLVELPGQNLKIVSAGVLALGRLRVGQHLGIITRFLKHEEDRVRANSVEALEALGEPKVTPLVQSSVMDHNARTRANAVKALWKYGDLWVVDNAKTMLESPDPRMRASAAYAVGEMADMARNAPRLVSLPLLMMALRRHPKFNEMKSVLDPRSI
jgi:HEAT repeat protein